MLVYDMERKINYTHITSLYLHYFHRLNYICSEAGTKGELLIYACITTVSLGGSPG